MGETASAEEDDESPTIPGVIGAATAAANSGPGRALLVPAAKVLGDYWGERVEEWTKKWREKRLKNIQAHQEKVRTVEELGSTPPQPSEKQFSLLQIWAEGAQTVDPDEEPELAALWEAVLGGIHKNRRHTQQLLDVVRELTPDDARTLMNFHRRPRSYERAAYEHLVSLGVAQRFSIVDRFSSLVFVALPLVLAGAIMLVSAPDFVAILYGANTEFSPAELDNMSSQMRGLTSLLLATVVAVIGPILLNMLGTFSLTDVGATVQGSAHRYLASKRTT